MMVTSPSASHPAYGGIKKRIQLMKVFTIIICFLLVSLTLDQAFSRQRALSPEEKTHLKQAQEISLQTVALTEKGLVDSQEIRHVVSKRLQIFGYTIIKEDEKSHDVVVKVKCEERKTRTGPSTYGGDADSLYSPSPSWKGPACQITFGLNGEQFAWRKEVRTDFEDAIAAANKLNLPNAGEYALTELSKKLEQDDFPLLLTAEWEQAERLINLMKRPEIDKSLKFKHFVTALHKPDTEIPVKTEIVKALGKLADQRAIPILEELNRQAWTDPSHSPEMQELREALSWSLWQLNPDAHTG
jgi:hypothetical protein